MYLISEIYIISKKASSINDVLKRFSSSFFIFFTRVLSQKQFSSFLICIIFSRELKTRPTCTTRPADTMDVCVDVPGHVIVDNRPDPRDVQTSRCNTQMPVVLSTNTTAYCRSTTQILYKSFLIYFQNVTER